MPQTQLPTCHVKQNKHWHLTFLLLSHTFNNIFLTLAQFIQPIDYIYIKSALHSQPANQP